MTHIAFVVPDPSLVKVVHDAWSLYEKVFGKRQDMRYTVDCEIEPEVIEELTQLIYTLTGCKEVHHTMAGCTVSTHCGPRTLGVLFIEE